MNAVRFSLATFYDRIESGLPRFFHSRAKTPKPKFSLSRTTPTLSRYRINNGQYSYRSF